MTTAPMADGKVDPNLSRKTGTPVGGSRAKGCKAYAVDLSAYFDGELEGDALEKMEKHLADCPGCRDTLQRLGKLRAALHSMTRPPRRRRSILEDLQARLAEEDDDPPESGKPLVC